jgi:hypothetical protein
MSKGDNMDFDFLMGTEFDEDGDDVERNLPPPEIIRIKSSVKSPLILILDPTADHTTMRDVSMLDAILFNHIPFPAFKLLSDVMLIRSQSVTERMESVQLQQRSVTLPEEAQKHRAAAPDNVIVTPDDHDIPAIGSEAEPKVRKPRKKKKVDDDD